MDKDWPQTPKPEPTPIFDTWKKCPNCDYDAELRAVYKDEAAPTDDPDLFAVRRSSQRIIIHFYCPSCGLTSEQRETYLEKHALRSQSSDK